MTKPPGKISAPTNGETGLKCRRDCQFGCDGEDCTRQRATN